MKALMVTKTGGPTVCETASPTVGLGEDLVQVRAAGMNFADLMSAGGKYPGTPPVPFVAGREFCGVRESDGQLVMGYTQWGAFAEKVAGRSELLWPVPPGWSAETGAAFPVNYFTAYLAYWKAGLLERSSSSTRVLIHAVAGGVGTAAVQIGKLLGIEMYGTSSSEEKLTRVAELGLQHMINYKEKDYEQAIKELTGDEGVDAVFEMLGGEHVAKGVRCLREFGRMIVYGNASGKKTEFDPQILYARGTSVHGLWLTKLSRNREVMNAAWERLSAWAVEGHLHPAIGKVLPWENAQEAYQLLREGKNFGKIVLRIE
jgi:NADPH:quinone reductase